VDGPREELEAGSEGRQSFHPFSLPHWQTIPPFGHEQ
jgi:hypothetical protein